MFCRAAFIFGLLFILFIHFVKTISVHTDSLTEFWNILSCLPLSLVYYSCKHTFRENYQCAQGESNGHFRLRTGLQSADMANMSCCMQSG